MFILVDEKTNKIVGTSVRNVSITACANNGQKVYEIPDYEFSIDMIGSTLEKFDEQD